MRVCWRLQQPHVGATKFELTTLGKPAEDCQVSQLCKCEIRYLHLARWSSQAFTQEQWSEKMTLPCRKIITQPGSKTSWLQMLSIPGARLQSCWNACTHADCALCTAVAACGIDQSPKIGSCLLPFRLACVSCMAHCLHTHAMAGSKSLASRVHDDHCANKPSTYRGAGSLQMPALAFHGLRTPRYCTTCMLRILLGGQSDTTAAGDEAGVRFCISPQVWCPVPRL